jgi:hypothetical protein
LSTDEVAFLRVEPGCYDSSFGAFSALRQGSLGCDRWIILEKRQSSVEDNAKNQQTEDQNGHQLIGTEFFHDFQPPKAIRAHPKMTSHFDRRCIPSGCVAKSRNIQSFLRFHALPAERLNVKITN